MVYGAPVLAQRQDDRPVERQLAVLHLQPLLVYIPPDALEVFLETFEGPLDLLLSLIHILQL